MPSTNFLSNLLPLTDQQTNAYRPMAAWAMNDRLEKAELERQLQSFQELGYGGAMVIPWGGLPNEFMDDDWLDAVGHILAEAERINMEVWLWDDWLFPSGFGAGEVTKEPAFRAKKVRIALDVVLQPGESFEAKLPPRTLAAATVPVNKFNNPLGEFRPLDISKGHVAHQATEHERIMVAVWDELSGMTYTVASHTLYLTDASEEECSIMTNCDRTAFSVDMLNPDATRRFIELIHERYWQRYERHFGKTLKGFFYDEPNQPTLYPWSDDFAARFKELKGYDLIPHLLPMLIDHVQQDFVFDELLPESARQVRADYMDAWTTMMAESFFGVIRDWCHAHGVLSIGHLGCDDTLASVVSASGMYFKNMGYVDMPGLDIIFDQLPMGLFNDMPRVAASRASVQGQPRVLSETFAGTGHGMYPDLMRYMMEHQIIRGVNKFFNKLSNYNPERSWYFHPPELTAANPIIATYGAHIHERITRLCALAAAGKPPERVGLYVPAINFYRGDKAAAKHLDELARQLTYHQWEFDYLWDGDFAALETQGGKLVNKSGIAYGGVVIPPGARIDPLTAERLAAIPDRRVLRGSLKGLDEVMDGVRSLIVNPPGAPISMMTRKLGNRIIHLLLNESGANQTVVLTALAVGTLSEIDLETGITYGLGRGANVEVTFSKGESKLIVLDTVGQADHLPLRALPLKPTIELTDWTLYLPDGTSLALANPLPAWDELDLGAYFGTMRYVSEFDWDGPANSVLSVGEIGYAATVTLDGERLGDAIFQPFQLDLTLTPGRHRLEIEVMNTPASALYGTEERYQELCARGVFKGTYDVVYEPIDRRRLHSGLFGPVRIYARL